MLNSKSADAESLGYRNIKFINVAVNALWLKVDRKMSFKSKLKIDDSGMFVALIFYAVAGIISFATLPMAGFPPHIGIIGILSLIIAYGLFRKRTWTIWFVVILFFTATAFSAIMLYYYFGTDLILDMSMIAYLILTWIFTVYIADKRKNLES
jgi:uncharacterized membrane protein (DUF2068 family)